MDRREFLGRLAAIAGGAVLGRYFIHEGGAEPMTTLPRRRFGDTDVELSIVGLGGISVVGHPQPEVNDLVAWAVDRGLNYFDFAPTYGNCEELLGPALQLYRQHCFLACKTHQRSAQGAREELEQSLQRLQTDHFDLYQLHALTSEEDVEEVFGPGGAMETFTAARDEGKIRFIGFSAHSEDAACMAMDRFDFDSVLFPQNVVCHQQADFGPRVIEKAQERDVTRLALKAMAWTTIPEGEDRPYPNCWYRPADEPELADLALRYTLSLPITAAVPPGDSRLFRMAVEIALNYRALTDAEKQDIIQRTDGVTPIFGAS